MPGSPDDGMVKVAAWPFATSFDGPSSVPAVAPGWVVGVFDGGFVDPVVGTVVPPPS
jgi:hypothetical protein